VIVCVKTYSLPGLLQDLIASGMLSGKLKGVDFILLMNGMGNRETFTITSDHVYEGVTSNGVKFSEDGLIELKGKGETVFEDAINPEIRYFMKERFEEKGFEIKFAADFKSYQWNKLFVNSVINPITALTRRQNGVVLSKSLRKTIERIVGECVSVAVEEGCPSDKNSVLNLVYSVASKTSLNTSSMLQDLEKGKKTEIDSINGYVIGLAKRYSISAPVNETLYSLVMLIEMNNANQ
jgi:2-dehydropantoate 2-reductase